MDWSQTTVSSGKWRRDSDVCLSFYVFVIQCQCRPVLASVMACLRFHNSRHHVLTPALCCTWNPALLNKPKNRPSPGGKMLCCDFCEKMMGSKNSFESKYSSHSSAQRFNRITPMFYLTGCFDKYVVAGKKLFTPVSVGKDCVVFHCTSGESQRNCYAWAESKRASWTLSDPCDATFIHFLPPSALHPLFRDCWSHVA